MVIMYGLFAMVGAIISVILSGSISLGVIAMGGFVGGLTCTCLAVTFNLKN